MYWKPCKEYSLGTTKKGCLRHGLPVKCRRKLAGDWILGSAGWPVTKVRSGLQAPTWFFMCFLQVHFKRETHHQWVLDGFGLLPFLQLVELGGIPMLIHTLTAVVGIERVLHRYPSSTSSLAAQKPVHLLS